MIAKLTDLKSKTSNQKVKALCEATITSLSSTIYNGVTPEARLEIERVSLDALFEELAKYPDDKVITDWLINQKRMHALRHLGVRKAVNTLLETEARHNDTLAIILDYYREKLDKFPEVLLYEGFISALSSFNYLPAVNTELGAIVARVKQYKNDVDITKILEVMKETRSNYLLPLIEDVVENYLNDKNAQTKSFLKETLVKFSYDPFIRDIINILTLDATDLQLEYANAQCDISNRLFSPIKYLGEGEALFNIKGTYYVKKGNNINKVKKSDVQKIDEDFRSLCDIVNMPCVEFSKKDINVYIGNDNASISEDKIFVNGKQMTEKQLNESSVVSEWAGNTYFFNVVRLLKENFDEIAELDFAKRVFLKENEDYAADVFKLRDNIFITTFDPANNKATFYRNINPIQAEKVMMEHMRFDVSKTFEDILPNKEKILYEIEETKKSYSSYIKELEDKIDTFKNYKQTDTTVAVISTLEEALEEAKSDYKNYLNEVEQFTSVAENLQITVTDDQTKKSYTVVVPTGAMAAKGEQGNGEIGAETTDAGTEVGASYLPAPEGPASAVTFDAEQSELLSDEPSDETDKVDLDADQVEAQADVKDAEKKAEGGEGGEEGEEKPGELGNVEEPEQPGDELGLGPETETGTELDLRAGSEEPSEETPEEETPEKEEGAEAPKKKPEKVDRNPKDLNEPRKVRKVFLKRPKK